jgi:signal transduction histidine kinase
MPVPSMGKTAKLNFQEASGRASQAWARFAPVLIVGATVVLAVLVILQDVRAVTELKERIHEENRLRMESCLDHVQEYFDAVYSTLLFISLDNDVVAMRRDSREYIQKMYDHQWEHHRLAEVYVVERDFSGDKPPFMTFERDRDELPVEEIHSLAREQEEYRTQMEQIRGFAAAPHLPALLSSEIALCTPDDRGGMARGFVYSVPIRRANMLVGIVAGMIETPTVLSTLRHGQDHQMAFLVNERGHRLARADAVPRVSEWFRERFETQGTRGFFDQATDSFLVGRWTALWQPARIVSGEKWWLVFLYNRETYQHRTLLTGVPGHAALAASLLLAGLALASLVRNLGQRIDEQARHLRERRELERQVGEVSEREQRRIGASLHEDLCQRLTGIEGMSRHLEKRLGAAQRPEEAVASEIAGEIKESLTCARQMADELQPVALLQHGFLAAIHELALNTTRRRGIPCTVEESDFPGTLDERMATHLYRIAQEALSNAIQHAQATQIFIRLSAQDRRINLTVTDDGIGMPQEASRGAGMGLRIMRYRSELIGAHLEIQRAPGRGTLVSCSWRPPSG